MTKRMNSTTLSRAELLEPKLILCNKIYFFLFSQAHFGTCTIHYSNCNQSIFLTPGLDAAFFSSTNICLAQPKASG